MPCRSAAPLVEIRKPAATRCPTTVGPVQPGLGCTATPTGLSMTTMASSSWTILMPSTISGTTATGSTAAGMRDVEHRAGLDPVGLGRRLPVDADVALADQLGGPGAGEPEHPGDRGVDALAGQPVRDA